MMATADLITAYLSNEMSPERERQFLLSVAASDALRLELKSHLMLDRMMGQRAQSARVPDAVRMAIFAQAGVSTANVPNSDAAADQGLTAGRSAAHSTSFFSRLSGRLSLGAAALVFFSAGYMAGITGDETPTNTASNLPAVTAPVNGAVVDPSNMPTANARESDVAADNAAASVQNNRSTNTPGVRTSDRVSSDVVSPDAVDQSNIGAPTTAADDATKRRRDAIERQRAARQVPVTIDGTTRKPTPEEKAQKTDPLDGGPTLR
ncbi:MAG: hypothetical protein H7X80_10135 [bacterium]|nr:hypothetical protein [Candidatus Kapabacteria bacterium]